MNNSVKGLLLSGLIIPGLGQIVFKHYLRGVGFMAVAIGGLIVMSVDAIRIMTDLINTMSSHLEMMEVDRIMVTMNQLLAEMSMRTMSVALLVVLLVWIISMVDAYRIGRRIDEQAANQPAAIE